MISRSGTSPGEVHGNPLQYSCVENPMDTGAWWATNHGVTKSQSQLRATLLYILDINLFHLYILKLLFWYVSYLFYIFYHTFILIPR